MTNTAAQSLLISVHMPKTGGLSFRAMLEQHFGERGFRHDYADYPLARPAAERHRHAYTAALTQSVESVAGVGCIHGHFLPAKYLLLADLRPCQFVTWLRHPVQRLVSHYYYWQRAYEEGSPLVSPLHEQVIAEKWSLEAFCRSEPLRNVYSVFLWGLPFERLDFVGITEFFADDFRYFCQNFLAIEAPVPTENQRPPAEINNEAALSAADICAIEAFHRADMSLYRRALVQREQRSGGL